MTRPNEDKVGFGDSIRARHDRNKLDENKIDENKIDGNEVDSGRVGDDKVGKKVQKLSKSKNLSKSKKTVGLDFFTSRARLAFIELGQAVVKAPIL